MDNYSMCFSEKKVHIHMYADTYAHMVSVHTMKQVRTYVIQGWKPHGPPTVTGNSNCS